MREGWPRIGELHHPGETVGGGSVAGTGIAARVRLRNLRVKHRVYQLGREQRRWPLAVDTRGEAGQVLRRGDPAAVSVERGHVIATVGERHVALTRVDR